MLSGKVLQRKVEILVSVLSTDQEALQIQVNRTTCDKPLLESTERGNVSPDYLPCFLISTQETSLQILVRLMISVREKMAYSRSQSKEKTKSEIIDSHSFKTTQNKGIVSISPPNLSSPLRPPGQYKSE